MSRLEGTLKLGSHIEGLFDAPLDARETTKLKADLTDPTVFPYTYLGMTVFVEEDLKKYVLVGDDPTDIANWKVEAASSGSGDAALQAGFEVTDALGGIPAGKTYAAGEDLETILRDMLYPLKYPTFTPPSLTLSQIGGLVYEIGSTPNVTFNTSVNRGKITPAYGTSGNRASAPTEFTLFKNGVTTNTTNATGTFADVPVSNSTDTFTVKATFGEGEQPKDSHGGNYDVKYPETEITSNGVKFDFVYCVWSNQGDITTPTKEVARASSTKQFTFNFPPMTVANPAMFSLPTAWTIKSVEVLNELSGKYEPCSEFPAGNSVERQDAGGNNVNYTDYVDIRGINAGARTIRVTIN